MDGGPAVIALKGGSAWYAATLNAGDGVCRLLTDRPPVWDDTMVAGRQLLKWWDVGSGAYVPQSER